LPLERSFPLPNRRSKNPSAEKTTRSLRDQISTFPFSAEVRLLFPDFPRPALSPDATASFSLLPPWWERVEARLRLCTTNVYVAAVSSFSFLSSFFGPSPLTTSESAPPAIAELSADVFLLPSKRSPSHKSFASFFLVDSFPGSTPCFFPPLLFSFLERKSSIPFHRGRHTDPTFTG